MENFDVQEVLLQKELNLSGKSIDRFLVRIPSKYPKEPGEPVFIEVFDLGKNAVNEQRYVCWVFSYNGAALIVGKPDSEIAKAVDNIHWEDLYTRVHRGMY